MLELSRTGKLVILAIAMPTTAALIYWLLRSANEEYEEEERTKSQGVTTSRQTLIEVAIPQKSVGSIIGRQGQNIKELQEKSGARMNFRDDNKSGDEDRILLIRGTTETAQSAECMIKKLIADMPVIVQDEMYAPQYALGRIIGRNGESIRQISRGSQAKIFIDRSVERDRDKLRLITISGTKEQILVAKEMIQERLDEEDVFRAKSAVAAANREARPRVKDGRTDVVDGKQQQMGENGHESVNSSANASGDHHTTADMTYSQWPPDKQFVDVYVSAVAHPGHFWVQTVSFTALKLDELTSEMNRYYESNVGKNLAVTSVQKGDFVAAQFENDKSWYRAEVMGVKGRELDVFYADYGDSGYIDIGQAKPLSKEYTELPIQSIECRLSGVRPKDGEWSEASTMRFEELTHCAVWKVLVGKADSFLGTIPQLSLVDTAGEKDININEVLVQEGYAAWDTSE